MRDEYLVLHGVPVQILVAGAGLETEAIERAQEMGESRVRVMKPEYLIALYIQTGGDKRRGRARDLFADKAVDEAALQDVLLRYNLLKTWQLLRGAS